MKLSFECTLDPKTMPIKHGKKFCGQCQKNVIDLHRKSDAKIASFFEANAHPCVIIYQDQLDRLPKRPVKKQQNGLRYLPYAAGLIAVSMLPSATLAQTEVKPNAQTVGIKPVTMPALENKETATTEKQEQSANDNVRYYLKGKVSIRDKKFMVKKGKDITIYWSANDTDGAYTEEKLAEGKLGSNGNFELELTKAGYEALLLDDERVYFNIDGFSRETLKKMSYTKNTVNVKISVSGKRLRLVGAYF
jgi:hypothetical protein